MIRGVLLGQYRDQMAISYELEYRFPVYRRFAGTVFGGVANVAPSLGQLDFSTARPAAGLGFRFTLIKESKVRMRVDLGFDGQRVFPYLQVQEAF
jgi:hypothetical protein